MEVPPQEDGGASFITSLSYIYYLPGDKIVTDLIVGNSRGDIGLVTCGKFILLKKNAHKGMVNNIKITDAIQDVRPAHQKLLILTTGEDSYVRFWDTGFNPIDEHLVKTGARAGTLAAKNSSVQSIDVFCCSPPPSKIVNGLQSTGYELVNVRYAHTAHPAARHQERHRRRAHRQD